MFPALFSMSAPAMAGLLFFRLFQIILLCTTGTEKPELYIPAPLRTPKALVNELPVIVTLVMVGVEKLVFIIPAPETLEAAFKTRFPLITELLINGLEAEL